MGILRNLSMPRVLAAAAAWMALCVHSVVLAQPPEIGSDGAPLAASSLLATLRQGGPMLIPLAVCSFLLFVFVFERSISLRRGRVVPKPFVDRFIDQAAKRRTDPKRCLGALSGKR